MPFLCALKDGQKGGREVEEERTREQERKKTTGKREERRKLFSLCFPFKDILTGQSPLCGREWSHFEVSYRQLEGSREPE